MSRGLEDWAYRRGAQLDVTRPGRPTENSCIESFNGTLPDDYLDVHQFADLADVRRRIEAWRIDDNDPRPHDAQGHVTTRELVSQRREAVPRETARL